MQFIQGKNRQQSVLFPQTLDEQIERHNDVRFIDLFVGSLNVNDFKFTTKLHCEGRPPYDPKDLLKLFIYGYLNSIRSSRGLEKQCRINIEVRWLLGELVPDHNTISNFRRDNEKAIRQVFRHTVSMAKNFDLIGGKLIAGDSTKLRAQNSKKNNFSENKIAQLQNYLESKVQEYTLALQEADDISRPGIEEKINLKTAQQEKYSQLSDQLHCTDQTQVSTSDPDSRLLVVANQSAVGYSIQTTVDEKHKITLDYKVTNENDSRALSTMVRRAQTIIGNKSFTGLYDKGYHTGIELKKINDHQFENIVVAVPNPTSYAPHPDYNYNQFTYNEKDDSYTCPEQHTLTSSGVWSIKESSHSSYRVKQYRTRACTDCPVRNLCTRNKNGRVIERTEYHKYIEQNKTNLEANKSVYKSRQAIIEHTYGIIKRQWGYTYVCTKKGIKRASADVGLMFTALNLRRLINILGIDLFKTFLRGLLRQFYVIKACYQKLKEAIWQKQNFCVQRVLVNMGMLICLLIASGNIDL